MLLPFFEGGVHSRSHSPTFSNFIYPSKAPGTFRYDHSKYRAFKEDNNDNSDAFIPLDEFGVPPPSSSMAPMSEEGPSKLRDPLVLRNPKEEVHVPQTMMPYAKVDVNQGQKIHQMQMEEEQEQEKGAGCCRCVVM